MFWWPVRKSPVRKIWSLQLKSTHRYPFPPLDIGDDPSVHWRGTVGYSPSQVSILNMGFLRTMDFLVCVCRKKNNA
ncbi:hypothetical protein NPIL_582161 [Nephila pilipes]|uniref:Uncharacterized protein n=1 Tax=Nephila pilipes TaxID=299642 RepID=A0A8X6N8I0_NEPPI|nr:hypothetical protein NPIL_582161 [Nephila pilipes]